MTKESPQTLNLGAIAVVVKPGSCSGPIPKTGLILQTRAMSP
ncbi:hypothetical protein [Laspinema olomoucense]|nr:hypothetical protein [Laspinema sp. D3b]